MEQVVLLDRMVAMGRKQRIHYAGAVYHVFDRGVDGRAIFIDDKDRTLFLTIMREMESACGIKVIAYCLMTTHFHLAVRVGSISLAIVMQKFLSRYCATFNFKYTRVGHLFQQRYHAKLCADERYLASIVPYIHMNPVEAGIVARPGDWPWSSYVDGDPCDISPGFNPWGTDEEEISIMRSESLQRIALDDLGRAAAAQSGVDASIMRRADRRYAVISAKKTFAAAAVSAGYSLVEIARWLNSTRSAVSRYAKRELRNNGMPDPN